MRRAPPGPCDPRAPTEADLNRLSYTEAVFNEALRLYPPAHATSRLVGDEEVEVRRGGGDAGARVCLPGLGGDVPY